MAIAPVPISELAPKPRVVGVPAAPGLLGRVLGLKDTESERRIGDAGVIAAAGGRGVLPGLHNPLQAPATALVCKALVSVSC